MFLGILTAIGGFVDIGDLVANSATGARFELNLAWVVVVGVIGIVVYAEMCGRVAAVAGRPVFDLVRERLGPRFGLANLVASFFINLLTLTAELAGVAIAISLLVECHLSLLDPGGALPRLGRDLAHAVLHDGAALRSARPRPARVRRDGLAPGSGLGAARPSNASHPHIPEHETVFTYAYYGIALFGAAMTPYEVFFFSSGAVEERWTGKDLGHQSGQRHDRLSSRRPAVAGHHGLRPRSSSPRRHLGRISSRRWPCRWRRTSARSGSAFAHPRNLRRHVRRRARDRPCPRATPWPSTSGGSGASTCDRVRLRGSTWSCWPGRRRRAVGHHGRRSGEGHRVLDRLSAAALPLTYFPILVVANDPIYMGNNTNGRALNVVA